MIQSVNRTVSQPRRYRVTVVPLDPSPIRGSHGRLPTSDDERPLPICSTPRTVDGRPSATDMKSLLLHPTGPD